MHNLCNQACEHLFDIRRIFGRCLREEESVRRGEAKTLLCRRPISIPEIGDVTVEANDSIAEGVETAEENNGVVLLPERLIFTSENMNDYNF